MFRHVKLPFTSGEIITGFWCVCCGYASYGCVCVCVFAVNMPLWCMCVCVCYGYTSYGVCMHAYLLQMGMLWCVDRALTRPRFLLYFLRMWCMTRRWSLRLYLQVFGYCVLLVRVIWPAFCHQWEEKAQLTQRFGQPGRCPRLPSLQQEQIRTQCCCLLRWR